MKTQIFGEEYDIINRSEYDGKIRFITIFFTTKEIALYDVPTENPELNNHYLDLQVEEY